MSALRIGVIVDDPAQASALRGVISAAGLQTKVALDLARINDKIATDDIDAWVLNLDVGKLEAESPEILGYLLDNIHVPVILCEGDIPGQANPLFPNWRRRLVEKLNSLNATINRNQRGSPPLPRSVWVLAGSVGGPDAVKKFLDALKKNGVDLTAGKKGTAEKVLLGLTGATVDPNAPAPHPA